MSLYKCFDSNNSLQPSTFIPTLHSHVTGNIIIFFLSFINECHKNILFSLIKLIRRTGFGHNNKKKIFRPFYLINRILCVGFFFFVNIREGGFRIIYNLIYSTTTWNWTAYFFWLRKKKENEFPYLQGRILFTYLHNIKILWQYVKAWQHDT